MPAEVDNPNIKTGINQIVQAILDMISEGFPISLPDGAITVNVNNNIATSGGGGCGCPGGTGSITDEPPSEGQPTGEGSGPGGFPDPDGWDDQGGANNYSDYKCKAANTIVKAVKNSLYRFGAMSAVVAGMTTAAAMGEAMLAYFVTTGAAFTAGSAIVFFSFVPGWVLAAIAATVAAVLVVVGLGVLGVFDAVADEMNNRGDDLTCALYNAGNVADAQTAFSDVMAEVLTTTLIGLPPELSDYSGPFETMFATILPYMLPNTMFNWLFEYNDMIYDQSVEWGCGDCGEEPGGDCIQCEGEWTLEIWDDIGNQGTITGSTPGAGYTDYFITAGSYQGGTIDFYITTDGEPTGQCNKLMTITITSGSVTPADPWAFRYYTALEGTVTETWVSNDPPTEWPYCFCNGSIRSSTAFTATFRIFD